MLCNHQSGTEAEHGIEGKRCRYNSQSCSVVDKVEMRRGYSREGSTVLKTSKVKTKKGCSACKKPVVCAGKDKRQLKEKETGKV